jgi:single-strand DNA-binding protein
MANLNFNKVILGGRLTADPELKTTTSGTMVTTFSVAVNRRYNPNGQIECDFHNVVAWKGTAEFICKHFRKGSCITLVGSLQNRSWTDNNNNKRWVTEVIADEAYFVDSKGETAPNADRPATESYNIGDVEMEEISADQDLPF